MSNKRVAKAKQEVKYALLRGRVAGCSADTVGEELSRIHNENGMLTAPLVVQEAEPETALLHPAFEWDNEKAGSEYRLYQARTLIRAVVTIKPDGVRSDPVYVHVPTDKREGAYYPTEVVVSKPDMFAMALKELSSKVTAAQNAVEALQRAAHGSDDSDRLAKIALAVQALQTAGAVVQSIH